MASSPPMPASWRQGYQLEELKGQHHRLLVDPDHAQSTDYRPFWETLRRGEFLAGGGSAESANRGEEIWIQGSYNPVPISPASPARSSEVCHRTSQPCISITSSSAMEEAGRGRQGARGA